MYTFIDNTTLLTPCHSDMFILYYIILYYIILYYIILYYIILYYIILYTVSGVVVKALRYYSDCLRIDSTRSTEDIRICRLP